jgi:hypothetical protein
MADVNGRLRLKAENKNNYFVCQKEKKNAWVRGKVLASWIGSRMHVKYSNAHKHGTANLRLTKMQKNGNLFLFPIPHTVRFQSTVVG